MRLETTNDPGPRRKHLERCTWNGITVAVPRDWELLQFSKEPAEGRLAFADRHDFRLELTWRRGPRRPDLKRMVKDYASRLREDAEHEDIQVRRHHGWEGLLSRCDETPQSRFSTFLDDAGVLVELVFRWWEDRDRDLEKTILESVSAEPDDEDAQRRWRCFGLDFLVPPTFRLSEHSVEPAQTVFTFTSTRYRRHQITVERRGLVSYWLRGELSDWLTRQLKAEPKTIEVIDRSEGGHQGCTIRGTIPCGVGLSALVRREHFESTAWICPEDGRLYHVRRCFRRSARSPLPPDSIRLSCCPRFHAVS